MISSPIDEIKNRLDIVEVIGSYIKLQKAGANYRALCPFHSEKKPSFFISPARQIWHCFGCSKGGNIFQFIMEIEGVEFGDALRILAQKAGVQLKKQPPELITERQRLDEVCELATQFFEKQLESKTGEEVKKYLLERGISEESIKKWRIGWAPEIRQSLSNFLVSNGYQKEEMEKAGLAIKSESADFFDRFRGRIMFPIFDLNSQVAGFSGRIFKSEDLAKYINTPNTLLYDKSKILYGLDKARLEIRKKDFCILVEGQIDAIAAHQAGFENAVATLGTALAPYQLRILKRYSENLFTAFDMDVAGNTATKRGIDLAQVQGFNIKVITMPEGLDPADIIFKNPKDWGKLVKEAKSILNFYFETAFSGRDPKSPEGKKEISKILLPVIKKIPNKIEQSHWIQTLSNLLGVKEEAVTDELKKVKLEFPIMEDYNSTLGPPPISRKSRKELLEERLTTLILKYPEPLINSLSDEDFNLFTPKISQILTYLKSKHPPNFGKGPAGLSDFFNYLYLKAETEAEDYNLTTQQCKEEFENCLKEIKLLGIKNKLDEISKDIKEAEKEKNFKEAEKLTHQFNDFSKLLRDLEVA